MSENFLAKQRKISDLAMQIYILTIAIRDCYYEEFHKDCALGMIEKKSKLIRKISEKASYRLEFGPPCGGR